MIKNRLLKVTLVLVAAGLLTGCPNRLPESLSDRAQLRWDSLIAGDIETAYLLLSPGYKDAIDIQMYRNRLAARTVEWTSGEVVETDDCDPGVCRVKVNIGFKAFSPVPGVSEYEGEHVQTERWIEVKGDWYHVPDNIR